MFFLDVFLLHACVLCSQAFLPHVFLLDASLLHMFLLHGNDLLVLEIIE